MGTLLVDDVTGVVSWDFSYADIDAPTAMHIHTGAAGVPGGIFIGLGVTTSGGAGTLIDSVTANTTDVASIVANPTGFYVNVHNGAFPGGVVRGQLGTVVPEPSTAALCALGLALLGVASRRPRSSSPSA